MKPSIISMLCLTLLACTSQMSHVPHAPPGEAAWFKVPQALPSGASPQDQCLAQRQSYDVEAVPGPEGVIWISIYPSPGACRQGGPFLDTGSAIYAVDSRRWRVLAVQQP